MSSTARFTKVRSIILSVAMMAALLVSLPPRGEAAEHGATPVNLQILAINDFHGNIATTSSAFGGVGRADYLAANMAAAEAEADNSIIVSAGDLIGASPLISALFHDEPTIEAMNRIGLDINGVGNHEFDEGAAELLRMANGGTHPVDGNLDGDGFGGAKFEFLAANVVDDATGNTIFAPYTVKTYGGVDVAFIGMTLEGTPSIVTPAGVAGLTFNDEIETVNALIPELQGMGIEAIVVLLHEGGFASEGGGDGDGCGTLSGNLNDIVVGLDDAVDLVIGGHNNQRFACLDVAGKAVTMAYHSGRMFTDIDTVLDPVTGDMTVVSIDNKENFQEGVTPAPNVTALIDKYEALAAPLANTVIGSITVDVTETNNDAGESALGDVIADAQLTATMSAGTGNAVAAFMNPGGIRDDLFFDEIAGTEAPGEVTFGEAFSVQPFGNSLVTMTLTGAQIHELLTQQWVGQTSPRILQVSEGFSYTWDANAADADKVDASTIMIDGVLVDPAAGYRVTVNSFLADGGDNFAVLPLGTDRLGGEIDLDALVTYFGANSPVPPGPQDRITLVEVAAEPPIEGPFTAIFDIQESGDDSPFDGMDVEVTGYVTGVFPDLGGFFLQDGAGDGDAATSDGIFVDALHGVAVGDRAEVRGTVDEFFGETRIGDVRLIEVEASGGTVAATEVDLPVPEGASLEPYEGMLITFPEYLFVSDTFNTHRFGEVLLSSEGALVNPTNVAEPGAAANAFAALNSRRSIVIDDGSSDQFPDTVPYLAADGTLRRGDAAKDITANLSFSFGAYKLQPTNDVSFTRMNPRPELEDVGGNVTVASFNVLNFFSTIDDGDNGARGADSEAEKAAQLAKLVPAISGLGADIVGLQEIENNGPTAVGELVDALNAAYGAGTWAAAADPAYPGGLEATNAIKVAIIFKTASVTPVGTTEVSEDPVFAADRPPIAHSFTAFGDTFTVVNNHFKSKSSRNAVGPDEDKGDGQGAYNFRRTNQAEALLDFVAELRTISGDDDVLVLGDFNSYPLEDPMTVLNGSLNNLVTKYEEPAERYSLVFFGQEGLLDGAFATDSLYPKVTGLDIWHINADEPRVLQYNDDVVDPAERSSDFNQPVSKPDIYSSSDHDPIVLGLALAPFNLAYSASADRSSQAALAGAEVSGRIYPFLYPLFPEGDFVKVKFYLDGAEFHTEFLAPFDFVSGGTALANQSWDSTTVADGAHTIMATGYLADGTTASTSATFTVNNAPIAADFAIGYSDSPFRTGTQALDGATVRGWIYAYVYPLFPTGFEGFNTVTFYLDGEKFHTEYAAPYDLAGGGIEKANDDLDTTTLADGEHTVVVMANRSGKRPLVATATFTVANDAPPPEPPPPGAADAVRFATFNASLNRFNAGDLISDLSTKDNEQAKVIAEIIQRQRPEVLLLNEFDFDVDGEAARLFQKNYLSVSQNGALPINYGYAFSAESNTGIPSGLDLDNSGDVGGPGDAFGFGFFPGQFGMQVYSQYPIDFANVRTFQNFLWRDMPGALLPVDPVTGPWYSDDELDAFRLSSKSHWDVPIVIDGHTVNFLVSHPTPPVFDGPEDRNGTRNHDEIRFWADYVDEAAYIYDDAGVSGGWSGDYFVIAGDQNSDPFDGDSIPGSAQLLLDHGRVNTTTTPSSLGGVEQAALQGSSNADHLGDPAFDTADFGEGDFGPGNLRADYVLPSVNLDIIDSGVFWPESTDPLFALVGTFPFPSSDHRMVWVDVLPGTTVLPPPAEALVELQILSISDWHGQLDPLFVFGEGTFGGAAELSAYFDAERMNNPNTLTLTAGDAYGAAPPLSSFFDEEPAVRAMRLMGFDADTFGNHNFDDGIAGLQSLIDIANADGGEVGDSFQYVSANLTNRDANLSGVKDYEMFDVGGVHVAVIGVTNPEAPTLVFPGSFGTIIVEDPGPAAMAARAAAAAEGADIFVLLAHMGVTGFAGPDPLGPLVDLANDVSGFDLILGDHTNVEFAGMVNGQLVVENRSRGRTYARVTLTVENGNESASLISSAAVFVDPVSEDVTPDPEIVALLDPLRAELSALLGAVVGQSTVFIPRADECGQSSGRTCESLIGDVVTDAMRATYGTDFAITNAGGLRADLTCGAASDVCPAPDGGDFEITAGTVLTVLPFGNSVVTLTVNGEELKDHLEQGVSAMPEISGRFAQVSGLCFTYDIDAAVGSRVTGAVFQAPDGTCTGGSVDLTAGSSYTLAENDFMSSGGDGYPADIGSAVTRELLDQVVADYIAANTPISPSIQGRITCTASGTGVCPAPPTIELSATLDGAGEVPGPGDDDGSGTASVSITGTKVTFSFTVAAVDMPTAAHIHTGAAGVAGGVVVDLLGNGTLTDNSDGTFTATGMVDIDAQLATDISTTPGGFYVNVHNAAFAAGAVRGQLGPVPPTVELNATLDGASEYPGPGDDDGSGTATVTIQGTTVTFSFTVANIDLPTAAHIHSGAAGVAGGVVVDLLGNGTLTDNGDGTFTATGMVDIDAQLATDISTTPGDFYVNVHNAAFAAGAVRGQLAPVV